MEVDGQDVCPPSFNMELELINIKVGVLVLDGARPII